MAHATPHWLFGDQLGPHFLAPDGERGPDRGAPVVMVEAVGPPAQTLFTGPRPIWCSRRCGTVRRSWVSG
ncbi:hypothetical protein HDC93_006730 [Streptomyces sp. AK010]|nr:hypothetical protein [Streptomyces sp. AK010]